MRGIRLILNDGTVIENGRAGYSEGLLWCYMTGYTMQEAASLFFDRSKTARIVFQYGEMQDEYEDYTDCINIRIDTDGEVAVCLKMVSGNA